MISGVITGIFLTVQYLNGFCHFASQLAWLSSFTQIVSMGFFQLSRLKYCFSKESTHSHLGYPLCMFHVMFIIGSLPPIMLLSVSWTRNVPICGINEKYNYVQSRDNYSSLVVNILILAPLIMILWDWITFALYFAKLCKFLKKEVIEKNVYNRIKRILIRIITCTVVYETVIFLWLIFQIITSLWTYKPNRERTVAFRGIDHIFNILINGSLSWSMFMMQEHNTMEYQYFMNKICCSRCCIDINDADIDIANNEKNLGKYADDTYSMNDISKDHGRVKPIELSMETVTVSDTVPKKP